MTPASQTLSSNGQKPPPVIREAFVTHLPVIEDKPATKNDDDHPRVALTHRKGFESGQCTTLLQHSGFHIHVGKALDWYKEAEENGFQKGQNPKIGSVMVSTESSAGTTTGHVALVIGVGDGYIRVLESNYRRGMITEGYVPRGSSKIIGYIYPNEQTKITTNSLVTMLKMPSLIYESLPTGQKG